MSKVRYKRIKTAGLMIGLLLLFTACEHQTEEAGEIQAEAVETEAADNEQKNLIEESPVLEEGEKTVYVKADANGNVKKITIETLMKDEEGEEFRYKEETDEELPVAVKISYYLNNEQITPEELAGKSGNIRIRFDYENLSEVTEEGKEQTAIVPFSVITALLLPSDNFSNVEVTNGDVISMEGQNVAFGYALPGVAEYLQLESYEPTEELEIPEYVEITADATDFELGFTATVITNGLFSDLEEEDLEDFDEMTDSMEELSDASRELVEGTSELYDGMKEFHSYIIDFAEAIGAVSDGTGAIKDGLKELNNYKGDLEDGAEALNEGLVTLNQSLAAALLPPNDNSGTENSEQEIEPTEAERALMTAIDKLNLSPDQQAQLMERIQALVAEKVTGTILGVQSGVQLLQEGSEALLEGVEEFNDGISLLYEGAEELHEGTEELFGASIDLNDGFVEVVDGVKELKDGFEEFDREGIKELEKLAGTELKTIINRVRRLKQSDKSWNGFSKSVKNADSVRMILETDEIK